MSQAPSLTQRQSRVVAITSALLGMAAAFAVPGVSFNPNRIVSGEASSLGASLGAWAWILAGLWVVVGVVPSLPIPSKLRGWVAGVAAATVPVVALWRIGVAAHAYSSTAGDFSRTSLSAGAWLTFFAAYVAIFAATAWLDRPIEQAVIAYLPLIAVAALMASGALADLSLMREYANNAEEFWTQLRLHLMYVLVSVALGLLLGATAGLTAARKSRIEPAIFGTLNVLEVLPTLAFIGLLNPVLTALSDRVPMIATLGVRGVGWAPVIIVLTVYAVYPVARNTYSAVVSLPEGVVDAASGMGMGRIRRLVEVELPLAAPVIIAGLRVALVQTTAAAIIAGLVGGGGLGTFVFLGAAETASDLILLGTIPIVALALGFDRLALMAQRRLGLEADRS